MFYNFFDKKSTGSGIDNNNNNNNNSNLQLLKNYTNQLLENLKNEKFILDLEIIFRVLI